MAETNMYNVIILDRMLPKKDGLDVLRDLRKQGVTTPVLILTAKDSVKNRVEGLDSGADDFFQKRITCKNTSFGKKTKRNICK